MLWRDAVTLSSPRPAIRRDVDGSTWRCYLDGSLDRVDTRGVVRRTPLVLSVLAHELKVSVELIAAVLKGKAWAHVPLEGRDE